MTVPASVSVTTTRVTRVQNVRNPSVQGGPRTAWDTELVMWQHKSVPVICTGREWPVTSRTVQGLLIAMVFRLGVTSLQKEEILGV